MLPQLNSLYNYSQSSLTIGQELFEQYGTLMVNEEGQFLYDHIGILTNNNFQFRLKEINKHISTRVMKQTLTEKE